MQKERSVFTSTEEKKIFPVNQKCYYINPFQYVSSEFDINDYISISDVSHDLEIDKAVLLEMANRGLILVAYSYEDVFVSKDSLNMLKDKFKNSRFKRRKITSNIVNL